MKHLIIADSAAKLAKDYNNWTDNIEKIGFAVLAIAAIIAIAVFIITKLLKKKTD